jgi:hypothetical protein
VPSPVSLPPPLVRLGQFAILAPAFYGQASPRDRKRLLSKREDQFPIKDLETDFGQRFFASWHRETAKHVPFTKSQI